MGHGLGGGTPPIKGMGILVVSLRGVNFGFWSHLGCSGQNAIIFSVKVSFRAYHQIKLLWKTKTRGNFEAAVEYQPA